MAASADDYFQKVGRSTATTLSAPGYTTGNTSVTVGSTTNWPTDTGITFAIDEVDGDGERVAGTYNVFRGTVASGTSVTNVTYVGGDANRNYSAGATTRVYILVSAYRDNRFVDGMLEEHNQDGTHGAVTADTLVVDGASTMTGAVALNGGYTTKLSNEWVGGSGTWTYASATTFTVPAADIALMSVGTKIWFTQTTSKYFYVTGLSGTTVTVTGGSDYSVANAAITTPYFSNAETPVGFPVVFNYTPSWTNVSGGTLNYAKFAQLGKTVHFRIKYTLAGAGVSGEIIFTLPVTAATGYAATALTETIGVTTFRDTGTAVFNAYTLVNSTTQGAARPLVTSSSYSTTTAASSTVPFTWANTDEILIQGTYEAA